MGGFFYLGLNMSANESSLTSEAQTPDIGDMDWALQYGSNSTTPEEAAATPLPPDELTNDESAGTDGQPPKVEAESTTVKPEEQKPEVKADESASEPAEAKVEEEKPKRTFEDHFLDNTEPATDIWGYLKQRSNARAGELKQAILTEELADPAKFAGDLYATDKELYGKLALTVFQAAPEYFTRALTGREGVDPKAIPAALAFYEQNKDGIAPGQSVLTKEDIDELRSIFDEPEWAEKFDKLEKGLTASPQSTKPTEQAKPEVKAEEGKQEEKPKEEAGPEVDPYVGEKRAIFKEAEESIDNYVTAKTDEKYGFKVTDEERELHPEIADLKDDARDVIWHGRTGILPPFYEGFLEWTKVLQGEDKQRFESARERLFYFTNQREKENALDAAKKLLPFADKYLDERKRHPFFTRADARIQAAIAAANPKEDAETIIPGRTSSQAATSSDPQKELESWLIQEGINR